MLENAQKFKKRKLSPIKKPSCKMRRSVTNWCPKLILIMQFSPCGGSQLFCDCCVHFLRGFLNMNFCEVSVCEFSECCKCMFSLICVACGVVCVLCVECGVFASGVCREFVWWCWCIVCDACVAFVYV